MIERFFLFIPLLIGCTNVDFNIIEGNKDVKLVKTDSIGLINKNGKFGLWKFYSDSVLINAYYYNEDKVYAALDVKDFEFRQWKLNNVSMNFPKNWGISNEKKTPLFLKKDSTRSSPLMAITYNDVIGEFNLPDLSEDFIGGALENGDFSLDKKKLVFPNKNVDNLYGRLHFKISHMRTNEKFAFIVYFYREKKSLYTLIGKTKNEDFLKYSSIFDQSFSSFNFD